MRAFIDLTAASRWRRLPIGNGRGGGRRPRPEATLGIGGGGRSALPLSLPCASCPFLADIASPFPRELTQWAVPEGYPERFPKRLITLAIAHLRPERNRIVLISVSSVINRAEHKFWQLCRRIDRLTQHSCSLFSIWHHFSAMFDARKNIHTVEQVKTS